MNDPQWEAHHELMLEQERRVAYRALVCLYCGEELSETWEPCCGEVHNEERDIYEDEL